MTALVHPNVKDAHDYDTGAFYTVENGVALIRASPIGFAAIPALLAEIREFGEPKHRASEAGEIRIGLRYALMVRAELPDFSEVRIGGE